MKFIIDFNLNNHQLNKMNFQQQKQFLFVKERLDDLRLSTTFPVQATSLLFTLINLIPQNIKKSNDVKKIQKTDDSLQTKMKALNYQLQKTIKQNNILHLEVLHVKEQNQILNRKIDKLQITRQQPTQHKQALKLATLHEKQLQKELHRVKNKHNQLLDRAYNRQRGFDHLDPEYNQNNMHREINIALPPRNNMQLNQNQNGYRQNIQNYEIENAQNTQNNNVIQLKQHIKFLQQKIKNREKQISRIQKKLEFDGLNMNKLLKDFNESEQNSQVSSLNYQVDLLNNENVKLKEEIQKVKSCAGQTEVLRKQCQKLRQNIQTLQKQKKRIEIQNQQKISKFQRQKKLSNLQLKNQSKKKIQLQEAKNQNQVNSQQLKKRIVFLQKQLETQKKFSNEVVDKKKTLEVKLSQISNEIDGKHLFNSYQMQDLKKKLDENYDLSEKRLIKIRQLQNKLKKMEQLQRIEEIQKQVKADAIENLKNIIHQQQRIIKELELNLKQVKQEYQSSKHHTYHHQTAAQEKEIKHLRRQKQDISHKFTKFQEERESQKATFLQKYQELTSENQILRKKHSKSEQDCHIVKTQLKEMHEKVSKLKQQNQQLNLRIQNNNNNIKLIKIQQKNIIEQNKSLREKVQYLENEINQISQKKFDENNHGLSEENSKQQVWLKKQLASVLQKNLKYSNTIKQFTQLTLKLKNQNQRYALDHQNFIKQADRLRLNINELQINLQQSETKQQLLLATIQQLQQRNQQLELHWKQQREPVSSEILKRKIQRIQQEYVKAMTSSQNILKNS